MVDSSLFLEEVRKIARNQFKIETARKDRVDKLEVSDILRDLWVLRLSLTECRV